MSSILDLRELIKQRAASHFLQAQSLKRVLWNSARILCLREPQHAIIHTLKTITSPRQSIVCAEL
jgi:hypothetical protein